MQHNFDKEIELFMTFDILGDTLRTGPLLWYIDRKKLEDNEYSPQQATGYLPKAMLFLLLKFQI